MACRRSVSDIWYGQGTRLNDVTTCCPPCGQRRRERVNAPVTERIDKRSVREHTIGRFVMCLFGTLSAMYVCGLMVPPMQDNTLEVIDTIVDELLQTSDAFRDSLVDQIIQRHAKLFTTFKFIYVCLSQRSPQDLVGSRDGLRRGHGGRGCW